MQDEGAFLIGCRAVDHIVLGLPHSMSLSEGITWLEDLTGVRAAIGGRHIGKGTHNAVVSMGSLTYLELLAVDPDQPDGASWMGMEVCPGHPRIIAWAARAAAGLGDPSGNLESMVQGARDAGYEPGTVQSFKRATSTGEELCWRLAYNHWMQPLPGDGLVPFLIAWDPGAAPPMQTAPGGLQLRALRAGHPSPAEVSTSLNALGLNELKVCEMEQPCVQLELETPKGTVVLS